MATVAKNYRRFSKIYIVNSDFSTTQKNLLYSVNVDTGEIKKAYYIDELGTRDLIYNSEGEGYWLGSYTLDPQDSNTYLFFPAPENKGSYMTIHFESYSTTYIPNYNTSNPSSNNLWITYDWDTGEQKRIYLDSYFRNNAGVRSQDIAMYNRPTAAVNKGIQHRLSLPGNDLSSYTYQWNSSKRQVQGNGNQKILWRIFQPRRPFTKHFWRDTEYGGYKHQSGAGVNNIKINVFYNVSTQTYWGTGGNNGTTATGANYRDGEYDYGVISAYNTAYGSITEAQYNTYVYPKVNDSLGKMSTGGYNARNRRVNYEFNCIHSSYDGDSYYYVGKGKTIQRHSVAEMNSYQQLNSYTTALIVPNVHDYQDTIITMSLEPYILLDIDLEANPSSAWEDMYCGVFMNPVGTNELWRVRSGVATLLDNKGLNRTTAEWETIIDSYTNEHLRSYSYPTYRYYYVTRGSRTGYRQDNTRYTYYEWYVTSSTDNPRNPLPPVRDFPDEEVKLQMDEDDVAIELSGVRYYYRNATNVGSEANLTDYEGHEYYYITQPTPDIDGQQGTDTDYVFNGQSFTQYNLSESITNTINNSSPYKYGGGFYSKVPWEWHDRDINIVLVNCNYNYAPTHVDYSVEYSCGSGSGNADNLLGNSTYIFNQGTDSSNKGIKGGIFMFTHNMKVNHNATTRSKYDSWNHFTFTFNQTAIVSGTPS